MIRKLRSEKGQAFPFSILIISVMLFLILFIADLGTIYITKSAMYTATDASALAGASQTYAPDLSGDGTVDGENIAINKRDGKFAAQWMFQKNANDSILASDNVEIDDVGSEFSARNKMSVWTDVDVLNLFFP